MQMFHYDNNLKNLEQQGKFKDIFSYLENQIPFSEKNYSTQIAYAWYLYSEGDFVNSKVSSDWEFYKNKWIVKLKYAIDNLQQYPEICFIIAYTLEMSGMDINEDIDYETKIKKFYELSKTNSQNDNHLKLYNFISSNRKSKIDTNCLNSLFPMDTLIDKYFLEVLS